MICGYNHSVSSSPPHRTGRVNFPHLQSLQANPSGCQNFWVNSRGGFLRCLEFQCPSKNGLLLRWREPEACPTSRAETGVVLDSIRLANDRGDQERVLADRGPQRFIDDFDAHPDVHRVEHLHHVA